jgi:hypothetical protein
MRYHPLLDWRLGVSFVRMLDGANYQAGLDGNWGGVELQGWPAKVDRQVASFVRGFRGMAAVGAIADDPSSFAFGDLRVLVRHPLWDTSDPRGVFAKTIDQAVAEVGMDNVRSIDSFDLSRRPSWVFQKLSSDDGVFKL